MRRVLQKTLACLLSVGMVASLGGVTALATEGDANTTVVESETYDCCDTAETGCANCVEDSTLVVEDENYGIQTIALTPDDWTADGYQPYHDLSHGTLRLDGPDENETVHIEVGEAVEIIITPYAHVQYMGCGLGSTCAASFCGPECWEENKGCSCGRATTLRLAAVTVETDQNGILSVSENCDYSTLANPGDMIEGTVKLTGRRDGEVNVTVKAALYDWQDAETTFTIVVGEGEDTEATPAIGYEAWTTVDSNADHTQRMHFAFSFDAALTCTDKDALTQELKEARFTVGGSVIGDDGSGGTIENVDLSGDGKILSFEVAGYTAQYSGEFVGNYVLQNLVTADGKHARMRADFYIPNGVITETAEQVVGSGSGNASVTTRFSSDENTTRGMVHLTVLHNGEPVNADENGATVTGDWDDYVTLTPGEFVAETYADLQEALGENWNVTAQDDTMTVTYLNSSEDDVVDLHVTSYLNTYYEELDTAKLENFLKEAEDLLDEYGSILEGADALQAACRIGKVRLDHSVNYAQTELDEAAANLETAIQNAVIPEDDSGLPYEGVITESGTYVLNGIHEMTGALTIEAGAEVTIDLNGYRWILFLDTANDANSLTVNGTLTITDTSAAADGYITREGSNKYAAIAVTNGGTFNLMAGAIKGTTSTSTTNGTAGGALLINDGTVNMYGGTLSGNTATRGGAVDIYKGTFNLYDGELVDNNADSYGGGAIYMTPSTTGGAKGDAAFHMYGGRISGNTGRYGGGIYMSRYTEVSVSGGEISDNNASVYYGGGIYVSGTNTSSTSLTITGGTIMDNQAAQYGGGIYLSGVAAEISGDSLIYNNTAASAGADLYKYDNTGTTLTLEASSDGRTLYTDSHPVCHAIDGWYEDTASNRWSDENITEKINETEFAGGTGACLIAAHGEEPTTAHNWDIENAAATWVQPYGDFYRYLAQINCLNCGETLVDYVEPEGDYTAPTCTEDGYTSYEADLVVHDPNTGKTIKTFSGTLVVTDEGSALGHEWGEWEITKEATIREAGEKTRVCERCGQTEVEEYNLDLEAEELETLVDEAEGLNAADYTKDSWDAFAAALQGAQEVLNDPDSTQEDVNAAFAALKEAMQGLTKASTSPGTIEIKKDSADGNWYSYRNGEKVNYTGFGSNSNGKWYVENGRVTFAKTDILKDTNNALGDAGAWYYVIDSKVQTGYTDRVSDFSNANGWWYIKNGKVDFSANTVAKNKNGWWYVTGGKVQFGFTGLANYKNSNGWWYIKDGKVDFNHSGVDKNKNGWWYVKGGKVDFGFTGIASNANGTWYIEGGSVQFRFTGTVVAGGRTYSVRNGKVTT